MPASLKKFPSLYKFTCKRSNALFSQNSFSTMPNRVKTQRVRSNHFPSSSGSITAVNNPSTFLGSRLYHNDSKSTTRVGQDRQLNDSFNGLLPRLLSLQILFREKGRQAFSDLFLNDVIITEQLFTGIKLYTDLQNPLLNKYQFNVQEFFHGSKEAFVQIQKAITMMHLMNHDLVKERKENYQLQEIHHGLLQASLSPKLFQFVEKKLQEPMNPVSEAFADYILDMNSLRLNSIVIEHVSTKVLESPDDSLRHLKEEHSQISYPIGSVLASVDVVFEHDQIYEHCEDRTKAKVKRTIASKWKFQGCISGHVPLNWMIFSMKHYIKNSTLEK